MTVLALEQLDRQKGAPGRHGEDVRDTLKWLDEDATTKHTNIVILQGGFDTYENWAEVERFALPKGLFSENDTPVDDSTNMDELQDEATTKLAVSDSYRKTSASSSATDATGSIALSSLDSIGSSMGMISPPTSPVKGTATISPARPARELQSPGFTAHDSAPSTGTPLRLRPLFNYILWRIHQELDPIAALEAFIFLCNDPTKTAYAKDFDIRTKRLEQLRDAINREDREFRNRQAVHGKENYPIASPPPIAPQTALPVKEIEVGEDPLDNDPPKAPAAMLGSPNGHAKVMDPDVFGRTPQSMPRQQGAQANHQKPIAPQNRGQAHQHFRGNRGMMFRGSPRGRANMGSGRGGVGNGMPREPQQQQQPTPNGARVNPQIDPNSFIRPRGGMNQRGGRKLWVPK